MRRPEEIATRFAETSVLDRTEGCFLVGIGGAGMSALARMLQARGIPVAGSDGFESAETARLIDEGISVVIGHHGAPVVEAAKSRRTVLVLSDAIDLAASPEVTAAEALGVPVLRRSQLLGWLLKDHRVIAVTGTHGKTTTTGMIGAGLAAAGYDPLVVVGAAIPEWQGPVREGQGQWAVVEACEAYDSFHDLQPTLVVLTNLELDHVDFHGTYENLRGSVVRFVQKVPDSGGLIFCGDDRGASEVAELVSVRALPYGLSDAWVRQLSNLLDLGIQGEWEVGFDRELTLPGQHNKLNAIGALMVAAMMQSLGEPVDPVSFTHGVLGFRGAERRLQVIHDSDILVVDDYAHHPTEVVASLQALRSRYFEGKEPREGRLIVAFQPHLYSRTAPLIGEFAQALSLADLVFITDIYPAREAPIPGISAARIAEQVTSDVRYVPSRHLLPRRIAAIAQPGDVVVGMGAGNISEFSPAVVTEWHRRSRVVAAIHGDERLKIAVISGGQSGEREVSLHSGRAIQAALQQRGHDAFLLDVVDVALRNGDLSILRGASRPDLCFLAVHGEADEGGGTQGLLELLDLPYTGSGMLASALCMDKEKTKEILGREGIRVPQGVAIRTLEQANKFVTNWPSWAKEGVVVKPNTLGSTVGISFVRGPDELLLAVRKALGYGAIVLVEEWLRGMEISTPVLVDSALPPVEIAPLSGVYDFESKYAPGATEEVVPARLGAEALRRAEEIALRSHQILGCEGATRTDAIVLDPSGRAEIVVLEVNTLPGMTGTSLLPNSAQSAGIPFDELCLILVEDALRRHANRYA